MKDYSNFKRKDNSLVDLSKFVLSNKLRFSYEDETLELVICLKPNLEYEKPSNEELGLSTRQLNYKLFHQKFSTQQNHMDAVVDYLKYFGLTIVSTSLEKRMIVVSGSKQNISAAFYTQIEKFTEGTESFYMSTRDVHFPEEVFEYIEDVIGLSTKEFKRPESNDNIILKRDCNTGLFRGELMREIVPTPDGFTGAQVADLYSFPEADGKNQTIGIIELGGGFSETDFENYFNDIGIDCPEVIISLVGNGKNVSDSKYDGEVMLDVEIVGAIVPKSTLVVYFAENNHAGFFQALQEAIHDTVNCPSVISISWGLAEKYWTQSNIDSFESILKDASILGITICVSSGDSGASDGESGLNVQYPSSSLYSLSCGGTSISVTKGVISNEEVWETWAGSTGGGFSNMLCIPDFQKGIIPNGIVSPLIYRGVPDVAGSANAWAGYYILVNGEKTEKGGTSAVAPLWAGLICRINQLLNKRLGYITPKFYELNNTDAFNQIIKGGNGAYTGGPIWNPCTGLGSPNGINLLEKLK